MATEASHHQACLVELRRIEEDSLHSGKSHFEAAASSRRLYVLLGLPVALISGAAGVSAFATFTKHNVVAGVLALAAGSLGAATTFLKPSEREATHHAFGNDYIALRNRARLCREIEASRLDDEGLTRRLIELSGERDELNKKAPQIPRRAFRRARKGIETGEADYGADQLGSKSREASQLC
jgi:hypothetical protein